jgi:hypothetical protein
LTRGFKATCPQAKTELVLLSSFFWIIRMALGAATITSVPLVQ